MPFSSTSKLPAFVRKMPAKKQRQWMSVFNSAFAKATKEGKSTKDAESSAFAQANGVVKKNEGGLQKFDDPGDTHIDGNLQERNKSAHGSGSSSKGKKRKKKKPSLKGVYKMTVLEKFIDATNVMLNRQKPILNKYDLLEKGVDPETIEKIGIFDEAGNLVPHTREEEDTSESTSRSTTEYSDEGTRTSGERTSRYTFSSTVIIKSVDKREWIIYGVVMEPTAVGGLSKSGEGFQGAISKLDSHNQFTTESEVRKAMIGFMEQLAKSKGEPNNIQHKKHIVPRTAIIENFQAPVDYRLNGEPVTKGSWVMGVKVYETALRQAIEKGDITGFSIEGKGLLSPVA